MLSPWGEGIQQKKDHRAPLSTYVLAALFLKDRQQCGHCQPNDGTAGCVRKHRHHKAAPVLRTLQF